MKLTVKIWVLIIFLIFSFLFIFGLPPKFLTSGITVTSIESNSSLFEQGLRTGQTIFLIDGEKEIEKVIFKKISALLSPSGKTEIVPMPIIVCDKCGKVSDIFDLQNLLPKELKVIKPDKNIDPSKKNLKIVK